MGGAPMSFADANGAWRFWAGDGLPGAPWLGDRTASPPLGAAQRKAAARNLTKELEVRDRVNHSCDPYIVL